MDARTFLKNAVDPEQWLKKSAALRRSGNRLWDSFFECTVRYSLERRSYKTEAANQLFDEAIDYLTASKLLYGLALETALKAYLLTNQPSAIEFKLSADGTGEIQTAEVKHFGVAMGSGHNLEQLGQRAGILAQKDNPVFQLESDQKALREILRHLSEVVYWSGRYPVPTRSGESHELDPSVPAMVLGHYIRDWLDPLLDFLQGDHAPPSSFDESIARVQVLLRVNVQSEPTNTNTDDGKEA